MRQSNLWYHRFSEIDGSFTGHWVQVGLMLAILGSASLSNKCLGLDNLLGNLLLSMANLTVRMYFFPSVSIG